MQRQVGSVSREMEATRKNQKEMTETKEKTATREMKSVPEGLVRRTHAAKESAREREGASAGWGPGEDRPSTGRGANAPGDYRETPAGCPQEDVGRQTAAPQSSEETKQNRPQETITWPDVPKLRKTEGGETNPERSRGKRHPDPRRCLLRNHASETWVEGNI